VAIITHTQNSRTQAGVLRGELPKHSIRNEGIRGSPDIDLIPSQSKVLAFIADRQEMEINVSILQVEFLAFYRFPFQNSHSVIINNPLAFLRGWRSLPSLGLHSLLFIVPSTSVHSDPYEMFTHSCHSHIYSILESYWGLI
jgi:hypothetical protein